MSARLRRRSRFARVVATVLLVIPGLFAATPAWAEDVAKARKLFAEGVHQYQVGDYVSALRLFREANEEHHAPAIVYNIALAEEKVGHRQAAVDAYEAYIAETGDKGEYTSAAVSAVAQIRSTSTKLTVMTNPRGAHVFIDGTMLPDAAPITALVGAGHHVVVAQGLEGWHTEKEFDAKGGEPLTITLEGALPTPPVPVAAPLVTPPPVVETPPVAPPKPAEPSAPDGLVWGAHFAIAPAVMFGVDAIDEQGSSHKNTRTIPTVLAGPFLEIGYALTEHIEFLGRGMVGIGPDGKPSTVYMGGPGLSFNFGPVWAGATFIGGRIDSARQRVDYSTDLVFGVTGEISLRVIKKEHGEWLVSLAPSFLLTEMRNDNTTIFFPMSFGYRAH